MDVKSTVVAKARRVNVSVWPYVDDIYFRSKYVPNLSWLKKVPPLDTVPSSLCMFLSLASGALNELRLTSNSLFGVHATV